MRFIRIGTDSCNPLFRTLYVHGTYFVPYIYLLKIGYIVEIVEHQALVYDYVNPLGGKGPFFTPVLYCTVSCDYRRPIKAAI